MADLNVIDGAGQVVLTRTNRVLSEGDFSDPRVILLGAGEDGAVGSYTPEDGVSSQQFQEGPAYLYIGKQASNNKLHKAASRLGLDVQCLFDFRDGLFLESREVTHA